MSNKTFFGALFLVYVIVMLMFITTTPAFADYPRVSVVVDVNYDEDLLVVEDPVGFIWEAYGIEDLDIGDVVIMILSDIYGTESILDDVITTVEYSGYIAAEIK